MQSAERQRPIVEVSISCGFSSVSYFPQNFKELIKQNPSQYRACCRLHKAAQKSAVK